MAKKINPETGKKGFGISPALINPGLMWVIVFAGAIISFSVFSKERLAEQNFLLTFLCILACINWSYFFTNGLLANKQAASSAAGIRRLVTNGVYAKVRHPIYSGDMFLSIGLFLVFPTAAMLGAVLWLILVLYAWADLEEKALIGRFGAEYERYMKHTPKFIPNYFK